MAIKRERFPGNAADFHHRLWEGGRGSRYEQWSGCAERKEKEHILTKESPCKHWVDTPLKQSSEPAFSFNIELTIAGSFGLLRKRDTLLASSHICKNVSPIYIQKNPHCTDYWDLLSGKWLMRQSSAVIEVRLHGSCP